MTDPIPDPQPPIPVLVIGIGNEFRRDDGAGIEAARRLRRRGLSGVQVFERSGEATGLIATWESAALAVAVDAVSSGAAPGTIHRFEIPGGGPDGSRAGGAGLPPSRIFRGTSHQLGLGEAVALAAAVGSLPARLVIFGIEGQDFGEGTGLTPAVARAIDDIVARVAEELPHPCPR